MLMDCVASVKADGQTEQYAYAVCMSRLGPKGKGYIQYDKEKGEYVLTEAGKRREAEIAAKKD